MALIANVALWVVLMCLVFGMGHGPSVNTFFIALAGTLAIIGGTLGIIRNINARTDDD